MSWLPVSCPSQKRGNFQGESVLDSDSLKAYIS